MNNIPSRSRRSRFAIRVATAIALLAGSVYAALFVGFGIPAMLVFAAFSFRARAEPTLLERATASGAGLEWLVRLVAATILVAAVVLSVALWRGSPRVRAAFRVWLAAALLVGGVVLLAHLPRNVAHVGSLLVPWGAFVALIALAVAHVSDAAATGEIGTQVLPPAA